ncbi:hypothetical protein [Konateibacter massiliensis]|uniref:hypothetical protein n=1 Tax=Konateibacter massiliensis TaxID=2002841 RepID=UPI000C15E8E6|nr:hypothetical protein [Konateibacter massiliensis]
MIYTDENKSRVTVFSGRIANELLRKGYQIVEVRPDKRNKIRSVFLFNGELGIENEILKLTGTENILGE